MSRIHMNKNNLRKARNQNKFLPISNSGGQFSLHTSPSYSTPNSNGSSWLADNIRDGVADDWVLVWLFGPANDDAVRR
jgi:hypothetical protein